MSNKYLESAKKLLAECGPVDLTKQPCQMGVDQAGRGPVLGPMVYGAVVWPIRLKDKLAAIGFNDSKQINQQKRQLMFQSLTFLHNKLLKYFIRPLPATQISQTMLADSGQKNLNQLSHQAAYFLIRCALQENVHLTTVYLDTVGPPESYSTKLRKQFQFAPGLQFVVAAKADSLYKVVSAASICAKVTRDHAVKSWQFCQGITDREFGSGYPAQPQTQVWLARNTDPVFGLPTFARFSWDTSKKLIQQKCCKVIFEGDSFKDQRNLFNRCFMSQFY